jgi:hypothetical protein
MRLFMSVCPSSVHVDMPMDRKGQSGKINIHRREKAGNSRFKIREKIAPRVYKGRRERAVVYSKSVRPSYVTRKFEFELGNNKSRNGAPVAA